MIQSTGGGVIVGVMDGVTGGVSPGVLKGRRAIPAGRREGRQGRVVDQADHPRAALPELTQGDGVGSERVRREPGA